MDLSTIPSLSNGWPFPGLRPFAFADHDYFFGRDEQIYSLYRLVDHSRLNAVVGSSGSGKSSLVRAGLLPLMMQESRCAGGRSWTVATLYPGNAPLSGLTQALAGLSESDDETLARVSLHLGESSAGISNVLTEMKFSATRSLLLVVDQFEQIFRYTGSDTRSTQRGARDETADFVRLLIEASRSRTHKIHVIITLRSDFIGECARFHDLPEAVCASQFLVPSLTRDQFEEVIVRPIEKAGATIEPALVERLLNDSAKDSDADQLPALQHCLMRLWEEAGKEVKHEPEQLAPRHLTEKHYATVGRISGALSRHADQILSTLPVSQRVVEQVFRALSEVDRQGRFISRPLPYAQLRDETGETDQDVRRVVNRFRSDDCSFLTPLTSSTPKLELGDRIDIGHEALLRRWERLSRKLDPVEHDIVPSLFAGTYQRLIRNWRGAPETPARHPDSRDGWPWSEQKDGQLYRALLARNTTDLLPQDQAQEYSSWWHERPRTAGWADRYGGGINKVVKLIQASVVRKQWSVFIKSAVVGACLIAIGSFGYLLYTNYQQNIENARQNVEKLRNFRLAVSSTQTFLDQIRASLDSGEISVAGASSLLKAAGRILNETTQEDQMSLRDNAAMINKLLITTYEIRQTMGDNREAFVVAKKAKESAEQMLKRDPQDQDLLEQAYNSSWRLADVSEDNNVSFEDIFDEYRNALALAEKLAGMEPNNRARQREVMFIRHKLGDMYLEKGQWDRATGEYEKAFAVIKAISDAEPAKPEWQRDLATGWSRLGQASAGKMNYALASSQYQSAWDIRSKLASTYQDDNVIQSNLSRTHVDFGNLLKSQGELDLALAQYQAAVTIRKRLAKKDPSNPSSSSFLAAAYRYVGDVLKEQGNLRQAVAQYKEGLEILNVLAIRDPTDGRKRRYTTIGNMIVELANSAAAQFAVHNQASEAVDAYSEAINVLEDLASLDPNQTQYQFGIFDDHINIGDVLKATDLNGASKQYSAASAIALKSTDNSVDPLWQERLAIAYIKMADVNSVQGSGAATENYQRAQDILTRLTSSNSKNENWLNMLETVKAKIAKRSVRPD
jgi:tetratricopeptide (TPR) repeat protein